MKWLPAHRRRTLCVKEQSALTYRAVTLGSLREDWAVVDERGDVVWRGDARMAAMIASRLTSRAGSPPRA